MRVFAGDETGLLKQIALEGQNVRAKYGVQDRALAIQRLAFRDESEHEVLAGLADGSVMQLAVATGAYTPLLEHMVAGAVTGLDSRDGIVMAANGTGMVKYWRGAGAEQVIENAAANVSRMIVGLADSAKFAVGGKDANLRLWDINRPAEAAFKAKNVKPNFLQLEQPIWLTDLAFVPGSGDSQVVAATAYKVVRLFDIRAAARPVLTANVGDHSVRSVAVRPDRPTTIVAGDAIGTIVALDLRTGQRICGYKGFGGSCRSLSMHPTLPLMAACGLDRHVRVYDLDTRAAVAKVYARQRQNVVLFSAECEQTHTEHITDSPAAENETALGGDAPTADDDGDNGDVWDQLAGKPAAIAADDSDKEEEEEDEEEEEVTPTPKKRAVAAKGGKPAAAAAKKAKKTKKANEVLVNMTGNWTAGALDDSDSDDGAAPAPKKQQKFKKTKTAAAAAAPATNKKKAKK